MPENAHNAGRLAPPDLDYVATVAVGLGQPLEVGQTPTGIRRVIPIAGGTVHGPHLTGTVVAGGADWPTIRSDGTPILDARYTLRVDGSTGDHLVSISTAGIRTGPPDVLAAIRRGEQVNPGEYYFRFAATASAAGSEHRWLTTSVLVATAARTADQVRYDLYRMT